MTTSNTLRKTIAPMETYGIPPALQIVHSIDTKLATKPASETQDWKSIFSMHPIISLLRPDFYVVFRFAPFFQVVYQENISLDLGVQQVSYNLISKYGKTSDFEHMQNLDLVLSQFTKECRIQPLDYICKVLCNISCPNESCKRLMRTTFVAQCDERGNATYGVMCFHNVTEMVTSIRPHNYDVTFSPDKSHLCHEAYRRIRTILPKTNECTRREQEIMRCLDSGLSSKEIGAQLFISKTTVDTHRQNMLRKWELPNTASLLRKAKEEGWI